MNTDPVETDEDYTGHELDGETGLHYAGARYYMAALGRWNGIDPMADRYPQISPYTYVENSPVFHFDPNGKYKVSANGRIVTRVTGSFVAMVETWKSLPVIGTAGLAMQAGRQDPSYAPGPLDIATAFVGKAADLAAKPAMRYADRTGRAILKANRRGLDVGLAFADYNSAAFKGSQVDRYLDKALFATVQNLGLGKQANIAQPGKMKMDDRLFGSLDDAPAKVITETILSNVKDGLAEMAANQGFNLTNGAGRNAFTAKMNRMFNNMKNQNIANKIGITITDTKDSIKIEFDN